LEAGHTSDTFAAMRKSPTSAFTLIEMLTVLAIIVILTGLVLSVGAYVQKRAALARTAGEVKMLESACENYKGDNGSYPRDSSAANVTDSINPKTDFSPTTGAYAKSSLFLYMELTGDKSTTGDIDLGGKQGSGPPNGIPDFGAPRYLKEFEPRILNAVKDKTTGKITSVNFIQDAFGFSYAYSTAAAKDEQTYRTELLKDPSKAATLKRPSGSSLHGFNAGSFDLWSTGGSNPTGKVTNSDLEWAKWVKNW
jgi:prepilin-type N-terminal cleavage/methylation domain-containing protein